MNLQELLRLAQAQQPNPGETNALVAARHQFIQDYIQRQVGGTPWIENVYPCVIVRLEEDGEGNPNGLCTVSLGTGKEVEHVDYGVDKPLVGGKYAFHAPSLGHRPWVYEEEQEGGRRFLYYMGDDFLLYRVPWPPPSDRWTNDQVEQMSTNPLTFDESVFGCLGIDELTRDVYMGAPSTKVYRFSAQDRVAVGFYPDVIMTRATQRYLSIVQNSQGIPDLAYSYYTNLGTYSQIATLYLRLVPATQDESATNVLTLENASAPMTVTDRYGQDWGYPVRVTQSSEFRIVPHIYMRSNGFTAKAASEYWQAGDRVLVAPLRDLRAANLNLEVVYTNGYPDYRPDPNRFDPPGVPDRTLLYILVNDRVVQIPIPDPPQYTVAIYPPPMVFQLPDGTVRVWTTSTNAPYFGTPGWDREQARQHLYYWDVGSSGWQQPAAPDDLALVWIGSYDGVDLIGRAGFAQDSDFPVHQSLRWVYSVDAGDTWADMPSVPRMLTQTPPQFLPFTTMGILEVPES